MSRLSTANSLLADVIRYLDSTSIKKNEEYRYIDSYKSPTGELRYKIDRYLNKNDFNYAHINQKLKEIQNVS